MNDLDILLNFSYIGLYHSGIEPNSDHYNADRKHEFFKYWKNLAISDCYFNVCYDWNLPELEILLSEVMMYYRKGKRMC